MQLLGYEEEAQKQVTTLYYSFDFSPMKDVRHGYMTDHEDGYVEVASFNGIAYGRYYTKIEAQKLNDKNEKIWKQLRKERGYTRETLFTYNRKARIFIDQQGNEIPEEFFIPYDDKLYFWGYDVVTVSECVAFMVRGIKADETFID